MSEITLRDLFAAAALAGIMANPNSFDEDEEECGCCPAAWQWAFQLADAMVEQRQRPACSLHPEGYVVGPDEGGDQ